MKSTFKVLLKRYMLGFHYVKSVRIRSFFWSVFSRNWTDYGDLRCKPTLLILVSGDHYLIVTFLKTEFGHAHFNVTKTGIIENVLC